MLYRPSGRGRRSATIVETTIVLLVFLILILGMSDLGIAVFRYHVICQGAREGARLAIVHGSLASAQMGSWGPTTYGPIAANDSNAIAKAIAPYLADLDPSTVTLKVEWPDGDNQVGSRVRVTVSAPYQPLMTFIFGKPSWNFSASSTMPIGH
jgi:Flp pilus assembly protein TadG